jgi:hypothetical protein
MWWVLKIIISKEEGYCNGCKIQAKWMEIIRTVLVEVSGTKKMSIWKRINELITNSKNKNTGDL